MRMFWILVILCPYIYVCDDSVPSSCAYEFSSAHAKIGTFVSPNYPASYSAGNFCTYTFNGQGKERVQISFTEFELNVAGCHNSHSDVDVVMAFNTMNGHEDRIDNFCGNTLPPQLMSNGPSMVVKFEPYKHSSGGIGFKALYRFVTDFGITAMKQDSASDCIFTFHSEDELNGTFTSPNFPGLYPRDTECHYFFQGKPNERVHIMFNKFNVDGMTSCRQDSDYVEISNFKTVDRKFPRFCGRYKPTAIVSDGSFFRVTFKSNEKFDGTGFEAQYDFKPLIDPATGKLISNIEDTSLSNVVKFSLVSLLLPMVSAVFQNIVPVLY